MIRICTDTKPNGANAEHLDIGTTRADGTFVRLGTLLNCGLKIPFRREFVGRGASQRIYWVIEVPDTFPYTIRRVAAGGGRYAEHVDILFTPTERSAS
jgi:hypothetical protein